MLLDFGYLYVCHVLYISFFFKTWKMKKKKIKKKPVGQNVVKKYCFFPFA